MLDGAFAELAGLLLSAVCGMVAATMSMVLVCQSRNQRLIWPALAGAADSYAAHKCRVPGTSSSVSDR